MTCKCETDSKTQALSASGKTPLESSSPISPCCCGSEKVEIGWWDLDPEGAEGSELLIAVTCCACGARGPQSMTNSGLRRPLDTAEQEAIEGWNRYRHHEQSTTAEANWRERAIQAEATCDRLSRELCKEQDYCAQVLQAQIKCLNESKDKAKP